MIECATVLPILGSVLPLRLTSSSIVSSRQKLTSLRSHIAHINHPIVCRRHHNSSSLDHGSSTYMGVLTHTRAQRFTPHASNATSSYPRICVGITDISRHSFFFFILCICCLFRHQLSTTRVCLQNGRRILGSRGQPTLCNISNRRADSDISRPWCISDRDQIGDHIVRQWIYI
jgi:hypothetical protein